MASTNPETNTNAADSQTDTATLTIERAAYDPNEHGTLTGSGSLTVETESETE